MNPEGFARKAIKSNQLKMEDGEIELLDFRMGMLPTFTMTQIFEQIYHTQGEKAFDMLFEAGKRHGEFAIDELGRKNDISRKQFFDQTLDSANILGLGEFSMEKMNLEQGKIVFRIKNSPFAQHFRESETLSSINRPIDDLQRGMFHSTTEEVFGKPVQSEETHCEFLGDDYCRFVIETEE